MCLFVLRLPGRLPVRLLRGGVWMEYGASLVCVSLRPFPFSRDGPAEIRFCGAHFGEPVLWLLFVHVMVRAQQRLTRVAGSRRGTPVRKWKLCA